jgi:hypothetical protein
MPYDRIFSKHVRYARVHTAAVVRPPGFEPGSSAWQADVLTKLDYGRYVVSGYF